MDFLANAIFGFPLKNLSIQYNKNWEIGAMIMIC